MGTGFGPLSSVDPSRLDVPRSVARLPAPSPGKTLMRVVSGLVRLLPAALLGLALGPAARAQDAPQADGIFVTVQNPITEGVVAQVKSTVDSARNNRSRNVKKVVFNFNPDGKDAATESYGTAYDLAKYVRILRDNGVMTIAYVHGKVSRHTVLPVIACDELAMSGDAKIGEVWSADAPVTRAERETYEDMAGLLRAGPVLKMIDKDVRLVRATLNGTTIYVDARKLEARDKAYADVHAANMTPVLPVGSVALYSYADARRFNVASQQAENLEEVREKYGLSTAAIAADPLGGEAMRPVRIMVEGMIDTTLREKIRRQVETAKARKENTFFFALETTAGGDPTAARGLADDLLALGKDPNYRARTIAFVPGKAPDLAIFVALACQERFTYKAPTEDEDASIGDFEGMLGGPNPNRRGANPKFIHDNLAEVAEQAGVSKLLVDGLF